MCDCDLSCVCGILIPTDQTKCGLEQAESQAQDWSTVTYYSNAYNFYRNASNIQQENQIIEHKCIQEVR